MSKPRLVVCGPRGAGNHITAELVREINVYNNEPFFVENYSLPYAPAFQELPDNYFIFVLRDFQATVNSAQRRQLAARSPGFISYEEEAAKGFQQVAALQALTNKPTGEVWYEFLRKDPKEALYSAFTAHHLYSLATDGSYLALPPHLGHQLY